MAARVLIIDDDHDFVVATKVLLESHGYVVSTAASGREGFAKVKDESPDLVLLDIVMSYKTEGADIARAMAQDAASRAIPIVIVTAAHKETSFPIELKPNDRTLPVRMVLEKPVQPDMLLKLVDRYVHENKDDHTKTVDQLESLAKKWKGKEGNLVMILHEIQNHYGYVPRNISFELSRILDVPMARIYEVITFYNYFKLDPPGKHTISVCLGTACYLKGAPALIEELKKILQVEEEQTTKDGLFHLQIVRCLGCCGLAPVIMIDGKVYSSVTPDKIMDILSIYVKQTGATV